MTMYSAGEAYQGVGRGAEDVEPIAIVGIGCRLPGGVESPAEFWELLKSGTDAITEVPKARYNIEKFYDPDQSKPGTLVAGGEAALASLCDANARRRTHHAYRTAVVARNCQEMLDALEALANGDEIGAVATEDVRGPVFVFSGMGPQWWAMGRQLMEDEPVFRDAVRKVDQIFAESAGWSIVEAMLQPEAESRMSETEVAQPANFALQVGLLALCQSRGIRPSAVVGHSAGEPAAAYAAGVYSLEEATRIIFHRSRLQQTTSGQGSMLAVALTREAAEEFVQAHAGKVQDPPGGPRPMLPSAGRGAAVSRQ